MITDQNGYAQQIPGPVAAPRRVRADGSSNRLDLNRGKTYLIVSEYDFYWLLNNEPAAGIAAAHDNCHLWPGMTPLYVSTEHFEQLHVTQYNTNGWVYVVEVS